MNMDPKGNGKRIATWWVKWNELYWPNGDTLDSIKRRAEAMAEAGISTAMLFGAHFRWDYMPYFTILHDYIAAVSEELKACGLELWDHHSVNLIHRYSTKEEMRHVMLHSRPHLPFSPSREAAASWEYRGKRLNDWRMIDVKTGKPVYYPQYASEGFCYRNPDFVESYVDYAKGLVRDTGITGLSADDPVHYMRYNSCACPHCRAEFKSRTGIELPVMDDRRFWGNWDNPAWIEWLNMRFDASGDFFMKLNRALPKDLVLTTCGSNSAKPGAVNKGADARVFLRGCNYVNLEMVGNTPPYKNDDQTTNVSISERLTSASHHQAAAREKGTRCFGTGFGFTEDTANIVWAVNMMLGSDCWFSTLKARLGLPDHILDTLPDEWDIIGRAFNFEKNHPELFCGEQIAQLGVYFSYESRTNTFFGNSDKGYYLDYSKTLSTFFSAGISPHTVFDIPEDADRYPLLLIPSPVAMREEEKEKLKKYLASGGKALVYGPSALDGCNNVYDLPSAPHVDDPVSFFGSDPGGVKYKEPLWLKNTEFHTDVKEAEWVEISEGLFYNPLRISEGCLTDRLLSLAREFVRPIPAELIESDGYLVTFFEHNGAITIRMLAEDFDTDIDHELDEMRFHRSRVNYINRVAPINVTQTVRIRTDKLPKVYTPFNESHAVLSLKDGICTISLPEPTAFLIIHFE